MKLISKPLFPILLHSRRDWDLPCHQGLHWQMKPSSVLMHFPWSWQGSRSQGVNDVSHDDPVNPESQTQACVPLTVWHVPCWQVFIWQNVNEQNIPENLRIEQLLLFVHFIVIHLIDELLIKRWCSRRSIYNITQDKCILKTQSARFKRIHYDYSLFTTTNLLHWFN